jgi:hypothetical protein
MKGAETGLSSGTMPMKSQWLIPESPGQPSHLSRHIQIRAKSFLRESVFENVRCFSKK